MCTICRQTLASSMTQARHVAYGTAIDRHHVRCWLVIKGLLALPQSLLPADDHVALLAKLEALEGLDPQLQTLGGQTVGLWQTEIDNLPF